MSSQKRGCPIGKLGTLSLSSSEDEIEGYGVLSIVVVVGLSFHQPVRLCLHPNGAVDSGSMLRCCEAFSQHFEMDGGSFLCSVEQ